MPTAEPGPPIVHIPGKGRSSDHEPGGQRFRLAHLTPKSRLWLLSLLMPYSILLEVNLQQVFKPQPLHAIAAVSVLASS